VDKNVGNDISYPRIMHVMTADNLTFWLKRFNCLPAGENN